MFTWIHCNFFFLFFFSVAFVDAEPFVRLNCEGDKLYGARWSKFEPNEGCNFTTAVTSVSTNTLKNISKVCGCSSGLPLCGQPGGKKCVGFTEERRQNSKTMLLAQNTQKVQERQKKKKKYACFIFRQYKTGVHLLLL